MASNNTGSDASAAGAPSLLSASSNVSDTTTGDSSQQPVRAAATKTPTPSSSASMRASAPPSLKGSTAGVWTVPSAGNSPRTSRNPSPTRRSSRTTAATNTAAATPIATQPSAAAIQRALSAASVPGMQPAPAADATSRLPRQASKSGTASGDATPQWPVSPRLKSPPPSGSSSRRGSLHLVKKNDAPVNPSISIQGPPVSPTTPGAPPSKPATEESTSAAQLQTPSKGPSRGPSGKSTLETVQENIVQDVKAPSPAVPRTTADLKPTGKASDDESPVAKREGAPAEAENPTESGSESAGKADAKKSATPTTTRTKLIPTVKSFTTLSSAKARQPEKQNMTVETETVTSIPQSGLQAGDRVGVVRDLHSGSIRLKQSFETIRPKKERRKAVQKQRSVNQSTASSKADIFEARVAKTVEDANTSDSDDTFVYESNPPEARRPRHHSRTPSVTSAHSVAADAPRSTGLRPFGEAIDDRRVAGKRSMKFSNAPYPDPDSPDSKDGGGLVRTQQPRHFGRFGRGGGGNGATHASVFDADPSPFTQASKLRPTHLHLGARSSRPQSPRSPYFAPGPPPAVRNAGLLGKFHEPVSSSYDFDAEGGDDECAPLMPSTRSGRHTARSGRRYGSLPAVDADPSSSWEDGGDPRRCRALGWRRLTSYLLLACLLGAAIMGAAAFLFLSNRPLHDVAIRRIQNVLASEDELMLDLLVDAVNPNPLAITITDLDVHLFARSRHASPPGSPPPDANLDPDPSAPTLLLGHISHFDTPLAFPGTALGHPAHVRRRLHPATALGALRLARPGNRTETGGSARWDTVLRHPPFELVVRGVLRYNLPVAWGSGARRRSAEVRAGTVVMPEGEGEGEGG